MPPKKRYPSPSRQLEIPESTKRSRVSGTSSAATGRGKRTFKRVEDKVISAPEATSVPATDTSSKTPMSSESTPPAAPPVIPPAIPRVTPYRFTTQTFRGALLICSEPILAILEDALDLDDYKIRLQYFWAHIFLLVRNLKSKERQDIFKATLPEFAQDACGEVRAILEQEFDDVYREFQKYFIARIEEYGRRWLGSDACLNFVEMDLHARKQKRPKQFPIPQEPQSGQDLLRFQDADGLRWNLTKAIKFWSKCLPAFATMECPATHIGWFATKEDKGDTAFEQLSGVALELIRQFGIYELRHPGGYSLEAHTNALRLVMPAILTDTTKPGLGVKQLLEYLGLSPMQLKDMPIIPNLNLEAWPETDSEPEVDFDEMNTEPDPVEPTELKQGRPFQSRAAQDALLTERLNEVDTSVRRLDEGLPAVDDVSVRDYEAVAHDTQAASSGINNMFVSTLEASLADGDIPECDYNPSLEQLAIPKLAAPQLLEGPAWTKRAEAYAKGNIWARQLMGQMDRALELRRLNALLVAGQHAKAVLIREEEKFQAEIAQLREGNRFLQEAWKEVQERIDKNKQLEEERDSLVREADSLQHSRLVQDTSGVGYSGFHGFPSGMGMRFYRTSAGAGPSHQGTSWNGHPLATGLGMRSASPVPFQLPASSYLSKTHQRSTPSTSQRFSGPSSVYHQDAQAGRVRTRSPFSLSSKSTHLEQQHTPHAQQAPVMAISGSGSRSSHYNNHYDTDSSPLMNAQSTNAVGFDADRGWARGSSSVSMYSASPATTQHTSSVVAAFISSQEPDSVQLQNSDLPPQPTDIEQPANTSATITEGGFIDSDDDILLPDSDNAPAAN